MRACFSFLAPLLAILALNAAPAASQNAMGQILTPFSTRNDVPPQTQNPGGHGGFHHRHNFPIIVFPWSTGSFDGLQAPMIQSNPVNTAPFAPPPPPAASDRPPAGPYKPPSVEIAPGGIEIVRGPG
jgi:hypothetical protein